MSVKVYRPPWRRFTRWPYWMTVRMVKQGVVATHLSKGPPAMIRGPRHADKS